MNKKDSDYDIIIIGGGPIGLACAIQAQAANLSYLILEKNCLVNSLYHYPQEMTFFSSAERLEIGGIPFVTTNPKPKRAEALEYYRKVAEKFNLHIHLFEKVIHVRKEGELFNVKTSKSSYTAKNVIVSTGFYDIPKLLNIPGEELSKVHHYYHDPHYFANQKVLVVGASNSSVDAALETFRKGATVTMVVRAAKIGERVKYWVKPDIENRIAAGEITVFFSSSVKQIRENEVTIETPQGDKTIPNDFVLALTGYQPDFQFLEDLGIQLADDTFKTPVHNAETMETTIPGLYLAGVVCGGLKTHVWFIENSRIHANQIVQHIIGKS